MQLHFNIVSFLYFACDSILKCVFYKGEEERNEHILSGILVKHSQMMVALMEMFVAVKSK